MPDAGELHRLLRAWRDRADPHELGLPAGTRRAPGLRREELATLAGVSVDYLVRVEQGRATRPSAQVVGALSRALRLADDETAVLHRAAGLAPPANGVDRQVPPGIERLALRLQNLPVAVYSPDWWLLRWNGLWAALLGDPAATTGRDRNLVWQVFGDDVWRARPADRPAVEFRRVLVADLRALLVAHEADTQLVELVEALRRHRPEFARLWDEGGAARYHSERKCVAHPGVGDLLLDCDVFQVPGSESHLLVYSAEPGSDDANRLDLLAAVGPDIVAG